MIQEAKKKVQTVDEEKLTPVARRVLGYLRRNPQAQDNLEGIARWWLLEHYIEEQFESVAAALSELVAAGLVEERVVEEGRHNYRLLLRSEDP